VYRLQLQHNISKHPLTQTITFRIAETGFVVKINIFAPGLKFQADFCIAHPFAWGWIFLKVGFNRIENQRWTCLVKKPGDETQILNVDFKYLRFKV